jgi:5-methylcytosine-specific restriction endonuclease McrA
MDHTPPLSKAPKGFRYKLRDVNPLCKSCNSRKYNRLRLE